MQVIKTTLVDALQAVLEGFGLKDSKILVQDVPDNKPGDYGSPLAFTLAKVLGKNPALIAEDIVKALVLPEGIAKAEAVGPYINFFVDGAVYVEAVITMSMTAEPKAKKFIVEHTSINPNKEAHVGHLRNIALGDACARILRGAGYTVEVQNYIDDTGRQAAESLFAMEYFKARYDKEQKYDHWLGELYVRLTEAKADDKDAIEEGVAGYMHRLEQGQLRNEVAEIVRALLATSYRLGVEYDVLVWESDIVHSGLLAQALSVLKKSDNVYKPTEGKYKGALVMDVSEFLPGLEEPEVVLVRSDGNAMYVMKDIPYQYWKIGIFEGLRFKQFDTQPSGKPLYSSDPKGLASVDGRNFAKADEIINVIDARQSHPQAIVQAAIKLSEDSKEHQSHHLAYEVVTLEGEAMSGRKGITLAIDTVIDEATQRAKAIVQEKNPGLKDLDTVARQVGIGALRFGMLKSEAKRMIDFRWEQALSLQGDSAPYIQYAHARACSILRAAKAEGEMPKADWQAIGDLELKLAKMIAKLPDIVEQAAASFAPHYLAQYALDLATAWNAYYNHKDAQGKYDTQVLKSPPGLKAARLLLVNKVKDVLALSLSLLGIEAPEEM